MLLTNCASCAAPLGFSLGKKCGRCSTRYCGPECQKQHWEGGGHDKLCKSIKKAGGAEQYHANNKYAESVAVAVDKCAEDTKGKTCYICMEAVHRRTKEGLVRGCACGDRQGVVSGTTGVVHVSCLAEQAEILVAEGWENNLGAEALDERFKRWETCSLCEQQYHGVVLCALGWVCWKTYVGRPEADFSRRWAMTRLGSGLSAADHHEDALFVKEAELSMERRLGAPEEATIVTQSNLANTYQRLGRDEEALRVRRDVYSATLKLEGEEHKNTLVAALNYVASLHDLKRFEEAKAWMRKTIPVARRVLGETHQITLKMRCGYARALYDDPGATLDDVHEAVTTFEDTERIARRVLGDAHPDVLLVEDDLKNARTEWFRIRERTGDSSLREAMDALSVSKYGS